MASELHYLELTELARRIHAGDVSPVEATTDQLARIEMLDGRLRSYAHLMAEVALSQARSAEAEIMRGEIRGPLHGVPIAVKDLCWMQGVPTAAGMTIYQDFRPSEDATVVRRLCAAGAIILGKLQLTEGAYADHHPQIPAPVNPWHAAHWPGASSSGSGVATAAGLCYGSLGSDTGGSIRFPAAANGVTGLKPTWGRVSRHGVFELAATLDHIGPMARSAADCGAMLGVIAGNDPNDPTAVLDPVPNYLAGMARGMRGLRVGVDHDWNTRGVDATTVEAVGSALATVSDLGAEIREVRFPAVDQVITDWFPLCGVECALAHEATYPARRSEYGSALSSRDRSRQAPVRPGIPEDRASTGSLSRTGRSNIPGRRPAAGAGAGHFVADRCADGRSRRGCRDAECTAAFHLSIRHDRQSHHHSALRSNRRRYARGVPVRRPSS